MERHDVLEILDGDKQPGENQAGKQISFACDWEFIVHNLYLYYLQNLHKQGYPMHCYFITATFFSLIKVLMMTSIRKYFCVGEMRDVLIASVHAGHFHTQEY